MDHDQFPFCHFVPAQQNHLFPLLKISEVEREQGLSNNHPIGVHFCVKVPIEIFMIFSRVIQLDISQSGNPANGFFHTIDICAPHFGEVTIVISGTLLNTNWHCNFDHFRISDWM